MILEIGETLKIKEPSPEIMRWCKDNLVLPNPEYQKKKRMNLWTGNTPQTLTLYSIAGNVLILPFGCLREILPLVSGAKIDSKFRTAKKYNLDCTVPLYDYQEEALTALVKNHYGILQSPAGSGKTQIGIALAFALGVRTLWLTHTLELVKQSRDRAAQYIDRKRLGTISEGVVNIGEVITFATIQTLSRADLEQYKDMWDCVIVDECHRVAGTPTAVSQFSKVLNSLRARHKYGLSATVHRSDGLIKATYSLLGRVVWSVPQEAVASRIMKVTIVPKETKITMSGAFLNSDGTINYQKMISYLTESAPRNEQIINDLVKNRGHYNLILSDRVDHLKHLFNQLPISLQVQSAVIDGKMTTKKLKAEREQAIEDMRSGKKRYLFATYSLAKEGLDIPRLDRLYLTTPQKDYAVIVQSVGRIARTFEGKSNPIAYDYVDNMRSLLKSYKTRCAHYKKCGCEIGEEFR